MWIPVILTVVMGPGMGQIYNKEYKKGAYLIVVSLIVLLSAVYWLKNIIIPYLPADITTEDPTQLTLMIQNNAHKATTDHAGIFLVYQLLLLGLWIYSVVDSYLGAKRNKALEDARKAALLLTKKP